MPKTKGFPLIDVFSTTPTRDQVIERLGVGTYASVAIGVVIGAFVQGQGPLVLPAIFLGIGIWYGILKWLGDTVDAYISEHSTENRDLS